jgi:hypothetical protein
MYEHACTIGLKGVVSKVRDSRYVSGHSKDWLKKTCAQWETLPIAGFALKANKFDGIYVGQRKGKDENADAPNFACLLRSRRNRPSRRYVINSRRRMVAPHD